MRTAETERQAVVRGLGALLTTPAWLVFQHHLDRLALPAVEDRRDVHGQRVPLLAVVLRLLHPGQLQLLLLRGPSSGRGRGGALAEDDPPVGHPQRKTGTYVRCTALPAMLNAEF